VVVLLLPAGKSCQTLCRNFQKRTRAAAAAATAAEAANRWTVGQRLDVLVSSLFLAKQVPTQDDLTAARTSLRRMIRDQLTWAASGM
jgi:hypothetical protein